MVAGGGPMKCGRLSWDEIGAPMSGFRPSPVNVRPTVNGRTLGSPTGLCTARAHVAALHVEPTFAERR